MEDRTLSCQHPCKEHCNRSVKSGLYEGVYYCTILKDTKFNRPCPFFRAKEETDGKKG